MTKDIITRVSVKFEEELKEIKKDRINKGINKKKISNRAITDLITKHNLWPQIKEDIVNYNEE